MDAFDDVLGTYERLGEAFSEGASDVDDLLVVNQCGSRLGAETAEQLQELLDSPRPDDPDRAGLIAQVRVAGDRVMSRRVRGILLGLIRRSFIRAATDLLRLRTSSAMGYLRFQIEAGALGSIINENPAIASTWQRTGLDVDGRQFFREHQPAIMRFADLRGLRTEYEMASAGAQHVRLASVAGGFQQDMIDSGERRVHELNVMYLEDTPDEPWLLILEALNLVRAQYKIMLGMQDGFPEVTDSALASSGLPELGQMLERLFARFRELFPDKVREWEGSPPRAR